MGQYDSHSNSEGAMNFWYKDFHSSVFDLVVLVLHGEACYI